MQSVLIAGCGDLGTRTALLLVEQGCSVYGIKRSSVLPEPIETINVDLSSSRLLQEKFPKNVDTLIFSATPDARTPEAYSKTFIDGLRNAVEASMPRGLSHALFVSSTAVYGDMQGAWADELSPCKPDAFNGEVLLQAENYLRQLSIKTTTLRLGGIYGPGRGALIRRVREGGVCQESPPVYTNRIHIDDAARILAFIAQMQNPAEVYIGVDNEPATQCEVMDWMAAQMGIAKPSRVDAVGDNRKPSNKRLSNKRIRDAGFEFLYPSFREGYAQLMGLE